MLMTEAEAKARWCPFARVALPGHPSVNRISAAIKEALERPGMSEHDRRWHQQAENDTHCIASQCMAWRNDVALARESRVGHCGLAGAPGGAP